MEIGHYGGIRDSFLTNQAEDSLFAPIPLGHKKPQGCESRSANIARLMCHQHNPESIDGYTSNTFPMTTLYTKDMLERFEASLLQDL